MFSLTWFGIQLVSGVACHADAFLLNTKMVKANKVAS